LFICSINWFKAAATKDFFQEVGDHADEMESSVMMHIAPELVMPLSIAGDGATKNFNLKGFKEGWAWSQRPWSKITKDTGSGNPKFATSEKGKLFTNQTIENIGEFLLELSTKTLEQILE
jgi:creatinine amidohydrolase